MREVSIDELKQLLVENCMLKVGADQITEDQPLFGPDSLGLDSIDALQLVLAVEKKYELSIKDPELARQIMKNLRSLREWIIRQP